MSTKAKKTNKCMKCQLNLHKKSGIPKVIETETDAKIFTQRMKKTVIIGDKLCVKCYSKYRHDLDEKENEKKSGNQIKDFDWEDSSSPSDNSTDDPDFVPATISSASDADEDGSPKHKKAKLNLSTSNFDYFKTELKSYNDSVQKVISDIIRPKDNKVAELDGSSGSSQLVSNLSLDFELHNKVPKSL